MKESMSEGASSMAKKLTFFLLTFLHHDQPFALFEPKSGVDCLPTCAEEWPQA
jgi:hypothetical protein